MVSRKIRLVGLSLMALSLGACASLEQQKSEENLKPLSDDFVYVQEIIPDIRQYIRYSTNDNFMGQVIDGYKANHCILKKNAAIALKDVQDDAKKMGYGLIAFDCYRPQKAVDNMVRWVAGGNEFKPTYFADVPRGKLIEKGYISDRSNHSKGYTIDLALVPLSGEAPKTREYYACNLRQENYILDFGTPYDCFNAAAHTFNPEIRPEVLATRKVLVDLMAKHGFENYDQEWWHFTHNSKPKDAKAFDFDVE